MKKGILKGKEKILAYGGEDALPEWEDEVTGTGKPGGPDVAQLICIISVLTAHLGDSHLKVACAFTLKDSGISESAVEMKTGPGGAPYAIFRFDLVLNLGHTELVAHYEWTEVRSSGT